MDRIAHAKAMDERIHHHYFTNYVLSLARESGRKGRAPLPDWSDARFWTDDVLNYQKSFFNQIIGVVGGINLARDYLGQFRKYKDRLDQSGKPVPINNLLSPQEWKVAFRDGVIDSLVLPSGSWMSHQAKHGIFPVAGLPG